MISTLVSLAILLGLLLMLLGFFWFVVAAFNTSVLWGVGVLLFPILQFAFLLIHWRRAKDPLMLQIWGFGIVFACHWMLGAPLPWS